MRGIFAFIVSLAVCVLPASAGDWYASIYGGGNWTEETSIPGVEEERGAVVGGAFGKRLNSNLRVEADLSYRTNTVEAFGLTANHETTGVMFNVAYDVLRVGDVNAYVLAGGGYAHTQATFENISLLRLEAGDIAYQAGAGVEIQAFEGVRLGFGYRFLQGPPIEVFGFELHDGVNHSAVASLSFDM